MITSERLYIIPGTRKLLEAALISDDTLAKTTGFLVEDGWSMFGKAPVQFVLDRINEYPDEELWWTYLPVLKKESKIIGSGGYKGLPDKEGVVEIGYEIAPAYRQKGLATEFAIALIQHAITFPEVRCLRAHTLAEVNYSVKVLQKCGFEKVEEINDPEDGLIWKWRKSIEKAN